MNKQIKDLTDLELGMAVAQGQQQLINLQAQVDAVLKELMERNNKAKEEKPEQEDE